MPTPHSRVNIVVTDEQYALLSELADLDNRRSVAAIVRELVDQVTPLLRATVPAMRAAKQELDTNRQALKQPLADLLSAMQQHDLLDAPAQPRRRAPSVSEGAPRGRAARPRKSRSGDPQGQ